METPPPSQVKMSGRITEQTMVRAEEFQ
jgi:hypothetical protein